MFLTLFFLFLPHFYISKVSFNFSECSREVDMVVVLIYLI